MKTTNTMDSPQCVTLTVEDTAKILGISLSSAYTMTEKAFKTGEPFRVIRIGKSYRIMKKSFFDYIGCGESA